MNALPGIDHANGASGYVAPSRPTEDFAKALHQEPDTHAQLSGSQTHATSPSQHDSKPTSTSMTSVDDGAVVDTGHVTEDMSSAEPETADIPANALLSLAKLVTPIGITEAFLGARVYGLHLAAQGYLSELGLLDADSCPRDLKPVAALAAANNDMPLASAMDVSSSVLPAGFLEPDAGIQLSPITTPVPERTAASSAEEADVTAETMASALASAGDDVAHWSERVLRLGRDGGSGVTAWLRDYRLNESELSGVLDSLTSYAREQGIPLRRVVLNGRQVWTSAPITAQGNEHVD
ncbi:hypothetical protein [Dyella sp.]|uniref:hypothetical protein n=1 Tax=Dyella sp. TaxID=1869338 RepID=UPI002ED39513